MEVVMRSRRLGLGVAGAVERPWVGGKMYHAFYSVLKADIEFPPGYSYSCNVLKVGRTGVGGYKPSVCFHLWICRRRRFFVMVVVLGGFLRREAGA